jgi:hypothetical protein
MNKGKEDASTRKEVLRSYPGPSLLGEHPSSPDIKKGPPSRSRVGYSGPADSWIKKVETWKGKDEDEGVRN